MTGQFDKLEFVDFKDGTWNLLVNRSDLLELCPGSGDLVGTCDWEEWFFKIDSEGRHENRMILCCNCGQPDCMSLWATVTIGRDEVVWDDFKGERGETFDIAFRFERGQYDAELVRHFPRSGEHLDQTT